MNGRGHRLIEPRSNNLNSMVTAYFDESYNHPKEGSGEPRLYTVACYYGLQENWDEFRRDWRRVLGRKGLSSFHMNKFEFARSQVIAGIELSEKNPYRGWAREEFDTFLDSLHEVIGRKARSGLPRIAPLQSEVIKADFDEARPVELDNDPECKSYYMVCVTNIMAAIAIWAKRNSYRAPIHYVFGSLKGEAGNLQRWFDYCWRHPEIRRYYRLSKAYSGRPYDIQNASDEPALQAADIGAYEINKAAIRWVEKGFADMPLRDMRKALDSLVRTDYWGWLLRKKELEAWFAEMLATRQRFPV